MASAATTGFVSSPPEYEVIKLRIQRLLSPDSHSLPSGTGNNNGNNVNCLTLTELCTAYEQRYNNERLPYRELGFETLSRFLSSMKDVVRMDFKEWPAKCYLRVKTNKQTDKNANVFAPNTASYTQQKRKNESKTASSTAYANVKRNIILLLQSSSGDSNGSSLTFKELCHQYSDKNNGQPLPYEQLGYASVQSLLETMWDSFRVDNRRCYLIDRNKGGIKKGQNKNKEQ